MKAPRARAREASHAHRGKNLKIQFPRGLGGYPKFFFPPNLIYFVTIDSAPNFTTVAQLLLGEKVVWVVVVGGCWWVLKVTLVLRVGPNLAFRLCIWTWTKLNNSLIKLESIS